MGELENLRKEIDAIDKHLLEIIQKRILMMKATGKAKKKLGKAIVDKDREKEKMEMVEKNAQELNIPTQLVKKIWKLFFEHAIEIEKNE